MRFKHRELPTVQCSYSMVKKDNDFSSLSKKTKQNLDKKLRFIPDNHGPYKKPAEDVGFI